MLTAFSRKKVGTIVFLLLWSCGYAFPQARHTVEVTRADFTKEAKIVSTELGRVAHSILRKFLLDDAAQ
jgi:exopolysaccharide biosynthesis protein